MTTEIVTQKTEIQEQNIALYRVIRNTGEYRVLLPECVDTRDVQPDDSALKDFVLRKVNQADLDAEITLRYNHIAEARHARNKIKEQLEEDRRSRFEQAYTWDLSYFNPRGEEPKRDDFPTWDAWRAEHDLWSESKKIADEEWEQRFTQYLATGRGSVADVSYRAERLARMGYGLFFRGSPVTVFQGDQSYTFLMATVEPTGAVHFAPVDVNQMLDILPSDNPITARTQSYYVNEDRELILTVHSRLAVTGYEMDARVVRRELITVKFRNGNVNLDLQVRSFNNGEIREIVSVLNSIARWHFVKLK